MTTDAIVKVLAVVGGGVVGGLGLGLLMQLLARAFTVRKLPRGPRLGVQLLGGGICAWLVALWVFGGGGAGIGGTGGWGFGSGRGRGEGEKITPIRKSNDDREKKTAVSQTPDAETLRIEVLGSETLKKLHKDSSHPFRIHQGDEPAILTMDEVKEAVKKRQHQQPPLSRIDVVLYKDSPDKDVPLVKRLLDWGRDLEVQGGGKMRVDITQPDADAPLK